MQLSYRGRYYQLHTNSVEVNHNQAENKATVSYRGMTYELPQPVKAMNKFAVELQYRGMTYWGSSSEISASGASGTFQPVI